MMKVRKFLDNDVAVTWDIDDDKYQGTVESVYGTFHVKGEGNEHIDMNVYVRTNDGKKVSAEKELKSVYQLMDELEKFCEAYETAVNKTLDKVLTQKVALKDPFDIFARNKTTKGTGDGEPKVKKQGKTKKAK